MKTKTISLTPRFKVTIPATLLCAALCLMAAAARAATNDLTSAIQRGLFEEEANQNLGAAIQAYQTVASQFDKDRKLAATAIFRLGECYRKQGNTNDAATQYERVLREFSDQPTLVTLSRQTLAALGSAPTAPAAPVISDAARREQRRLLEEEIKLVEKQLEAQKLQVRDGVTPPDALLVTARESLKLKRQLAALDAGLPVSITATETTGPAITSEADEVRRIQALIKDSPDLINAPDRKGVTLLQSAAAKGKLAVVKMLLDSGAAADGLQRPGLTALHYAAGNGHKAIVDLLLSKGAKADAMDKSGVTPLHLASLKGYESVAKALLAAGAPVNAQTKENGKSDTEDLQYLIYGGLTPLHLAAEGGYASLVELLLAKGAEPNAGYRTPLSYAVRKQYLPVAQLLLAAHADPNAGSYDLPLAEAAFFGDLAALKLLLANGANPNTNTTVSWGARNKSGNYFSNGTRFAPLFLAVNQQQADAVGELLHAKADPNTTDPAGYPLLFEALPHAPTLKALLEGGADPNRLDPQGVSPLLQAVFATNQLAVELLLAHQADPNAGRSQEGGYTPLHAAAVIGAKPIAELLLKAGASVNAKSKGGATPLHEAVWRGQLELAALLLANKADPNAKSNDGETPLHYAVRNGQRESAELLLANQADPNERNNAGQTPLDMAKSEPQLSRPGIAVPPRPPQPLSQPSSTAAAQTESKPEPVADLLRRHGALDDLPHLDQIGVRRSTIGFSEALFTKGAQDWNQFTLLELIAVQYKLLGASPHSGGGAGRRASDLFGESRLPFPDLAHVHISRPTANLKGWEDQVVDLTPLVASGDCAKDVRLRWGDVVEIPEADHPLNERWAGFSQTELTNLDKCLTRQVEIVVKGLATPITLAPRISYPGTWQPSVLGTGPRLRTETSISVGTPFWLKPVLLQSKLVLVSSDLSRVKVTRRDAASGQERVWVVDCAQPNVSPDFWLRDGDRIEVPEKTGSATAQEAPPSPPSPPAIAPPPAAPAAPAPPSPLRQTPSRVLRVPASAQPQAAEEEHPSIGGVLYSPKPDDPELLKDGYHRDRSARTRKSESWEERAAADLKGRGGNTAIWTGADLIVFGGEGLGTSFGDGARYCFVEDTWALLPEKGAPSSRTGHAAVWTGKEVIIWGGFGGFMGDDVIRNDGARYNPASDTWKPVATKNAPAARFDFPAVWTGKEMLLWGGYTDSHSRYQGYHANAHLNSGGRYEASSDSWKNITTQGAPSKRWGHTMVWTGKEMIVWGGGNTTKALNDGGCYNPARDSWRPVSTDGAPSPRGSHVAVWTGKEMVVWGGAAREPEASSDYYENGARYNPESDTWKPISTIGAPKGRIITFAVWTGTEMVVWGGVNDAQAGGVNDSSRYVGSGARYNPATDTWTEMTATGAPPPRLTSGVWTGEGLLTFGGYNNTHLNDTWFYSPSRTLYPYVK